MHDRLGGQPPHNEAKVTGHELQYNRVHNPQDQGEESAEDNERGPEPAQLKGSKELQ